MRFSAPADTSAISLTAGEFAVEDGFVDLPDDLGAGDLAGLVIHGFRASYTAADMERAAAARADEEPAVEPDSEGDAASQGSEPPEAPEGEEAAVEPTA